MHFIEKLTFWGKLKTLFRISDPYNCTKFGFVMLKLYETFFVNQKY